MTTETEYPARLNDIIANRGGLYLVVGRYPNPDSTPDMSGRLNPNHAGLEDYTWSHELTALDARRVYEDCSEEPADPGSVIVDLQIFEPLDTDLDREGMNLFAARAEASLALRKAQAAALRAPEAGTPETQIADTLGVDRMTVRKWLGK